MTGIRDWLGGAITLGIAADHGGLQKKDMLLAHLRTNGVQTRDFGPHEFDADDDYPDFASRLARQLVEGRIDCGILICRSGIGMSIAANRFHGVRAALAESTEKARLSRLHNAANILVTGGDHMSDEELLSVVDTWMSTPYSAEERHTRRLEKIEKQCYDEVAPVRGVDPEVAGLLENEIRRQDECLELIASENFASPAVRAAVGSVMTNKYAEGYPGKRFYKGCECVDEAEQLAIDRACELFGAESANVQPHSGSQANMAVYFALLELGDTVLAMRLDHGGHLTHGLKANFSGRFFNFLGYGVDRDTETLNYDVIADMARSHRPRMLVAGASAYPRTIDFARLREIADEIGAYLIVDMAHITGLVAGGAHPSPVPHCDAVTGTTHKTMRGPRGGLILARKELIRRINAQIFPGIQGGPLMHVIAGKAVCLREAMSPDFRLYQEQIVKNASCLCCELQERGFRIVSGGTDNHLMLVDLRPKGTTGAAAADALHAAGITANKNLIPFDPEGPGVTSGVRLGTPAVTTRGMQEPEMRQIGAWIARVIDHIGNASVLAEVRQAVFDLTRRFPLPQFDP